MSGTRGTRGTVQNYTRSRFALISSISLILRTEGLISALETCATMCETPSPPMTDRASSMTP